MGLLDALNSRDGIFALGLLDAASPKPVRTSIGGGLLQALQGAQTWQQAQEDRDLRRQQLAQQQRMAEMQMQQMQGALAHQQRQADAETRRERYLGAVDATQGPAMPITMPAALAAGLSPQEVAALMPPAPRAPIKLGAGEVLLDPQTMRQLASAPQREAEQPADWRLYQLSGAPQRGMSFDSWDQARRRAGAASTTVTLGSPVPVTLPDGTQALVQPANRPGEPPQIMRIPGSGAPLRPPPKEPPAALQEKMATNAVTLGKIDQALALVDRKPGSLGAQNYLPDAIVQRIDPQGVDVRAIVADIGGQKIHDRSGAAVSVGESARLKPYIPAATDTPDTVRIKLRQFRAEYAAMQQALASGASLAQADRASGVQAAPAASAGGGFRVLGRE